jgi:DNA-directed RNA polymerase subunit K/omega
MAKSKKNILVGGLGVKDDPDKLDKNDYDAKQKEEDIEVDIEVDIEEDVEEEKEEEDIEEDEIEEIEEEKEAFDKEVDEEELDGDECLYNITKKKNLLDIELEEGEDNFEDEEIEDDKNKKISPYVKPEERITKPFLFEFERVRILGERAKQISMGAKPMLKNIETYDPKRIAKMELEQKILPLIILRELPDGRIEKWKVSELQY